MSFSFNFVVDDACDDISMNLNDNTSTTTNNDDDDLSSPSQDQNLRPALKHELTEKRRERIHRLLTSSKTKLVNKDAPFKIDTIKLPNYDRHVIRKVTLPKMNESLLVSLLRNDDDGENENDEKEQGGGGGASDFAQELEKSDLITGRYEGGFKLWECSFDIIQCLIGRMSNGDDDDDRSLLNGKRVLECGCGHGLPGLFAIKEGATVDFQDYNSEVIESLTMMNVMLTESSSAIENSAFYSGDWQSLMSIVPANSYDLIVTSDTLYHTSSHGKLYRFMKHVLKPDGEILVAAKRYYFGCGGSVHDFKLLVERDGAMSVRTVQEFTDGQSNVREILSLKFI